MTKRKRRIMHTFKIDEISTVDRPAQEGATIGIVKRQPHDLVMVLTAIHDDAPNDQKSEVAALIAEVERELAKRDNEDDADLGALAGKLESITSQRMNTLIAQVRESTGMGSEDARRAAEASRIGSMLIAVSDLAENITREVTRAQKSGGRRDPIEARDETDDELDRMAKARSERTGEDFFSAYEKVCARDAGMDLLRKRDGFQAMATGTAEHGRGRSLTKSDFDEGLAVRNSELFKAAQAGADANRASDDLMKRAKEIQLERCDPRMSLIDALNIAKAQRPELAELASI